MSKYAIGVLLFLFPLLLCAQLKDGLNYQNEYKVAITKTDETIKLDGELNEPVWGKADVAKNFWNKFPLDEGRPNKQTEVMLTYDKQNIYIAAVIYDTLPYIIPTLKRDVQVRESDGFSLFLDPINQRTNGFYFRVNPLNVQADDLVSAGAGSEIDFSWDNKWFSATKIYSNKWTLEMAIPFKTLRYNADKTTWGINFARIDKKNNQNSTWTHIPVNFPFLDFGWTGALNWDAKPPEAGTNMVFIPYTTGSLKENKNNNQPLKGAFNAGFDGKIALNSSMNLDVTVNPDFSQIEVDKQVTNLTRFSIFFPERRTFFLENQDLFSNYGIPPIRPFYSRRIGLDNDGNVVPIIAGARLSGNLNKKLRMGLLNMQTARKENFAGQNYTALSFNQQVLSRSSVKAYYFGHEGLLTETEKQTKPLDKYGRNAGLEYGYSNKKGDINSWGGYHQSFKPGITDKNKYLNIGGGFFGRHLTSIVNVDYVGTNYYADMGFIERILNHDDLLDTSIRLGFKQLYNETNYVIYEKNKKINSHKIGLETGIVWNPDNTLNEQGHFLSYKINFSNTAAINFGVNYQKVNLKYYTKFTDATPLPPGAYHFAQWGIEYNSDIRKLFSCSTSVRAGRFYNGNYRQFTTTLNYRSQPHLNLGVNFEYNKLSFPDPYGKADLFLIAPKIEWNFNTKLFWTTFLQYNTQANNVNINSRLQWRYKPMSDFFLVYTDNYYSDPFFKSKSRALVFKLNYWLNM
jgi:hypothetical protein